MYRKRKRSDMDVEAITTQIREEVTAQVTQDVIAKVTKEVTSKVTQDVMAYLADQGLLVRPPPSRTSSPACGRRSSCASASNDVANNLEFGPNSIDPDSIDLLEEPTQCSLVVNLGDYRPIVAEGQVFPKEFVLDSVQIDYDYAIVQVECVHEGYEDHVLQPPPNDDTKTLTEALLKRIQWRRDWILVKHTHETQPTQSKLEETTKSDKSASKGTNGLISTKLLCGASSTPSNQQATSDATKSEPKEHDDVGTQPKVGTRAIGSSARPPKQQNKVAGGSRLMDTNQKLASKVVGESLKQPQRQKWTEKYRCGQPFLPSMDLKGVESGCRALHAHYMKDSVNNQHGIVVRFKGMYMLNSSDFEVGLVRYNYLYDLFNFGALDSSLLQCWTLSLVLDAKVKDIPVGFLDPQVMSLDSIQFDRDIVLKYLQKAFNKYSKKDYIMFAYNLGTLAGGHWIVVIVIQKWNKVIYLDSNRAFAAHTSKMKDKSQPLTHATKYACNQQSSGSKISGFYAAHHLILAMRKTNLECPEEFEVLTVPIDMRMIRERLAKFLVEQVIDKKGEFHHPTS